MKSAHVPVPESFCKAMVGEFTVASMDVQVCDAGGRLIVQATGQPALEILLDNRGDLHPAPTINARSTPIFEDGVVNRVAWRQGGPALEAMRKGTSQALTAQNSA